MIGRVVFFFSVIGPAYSSHYSPSTSSYTFIGEGWCLGDYTGYRPDHCCKAHTGPSLNTLATCSALCDSTQSCIGVQTEFGLHANGIWPTGGCCLHGADD